MPERTDPEWVRLIKNGDAQAIEELCLLLMQYAKTVVHYRCGDLDQAMQNQIAQEATVQAWQRITARGVYQFQFKCSFQGYCKRIVVNEVLRALRPIIKQKVELANDDLLGQVVAQSQASQALWAELQPCLDLLGSQERAVLDLYAQQVEPEEAAQQLNISRSNYNVIAYRARRKLRECLEKRGYHKVADLL